MKRFATAFAAAVILAMSVPAVAQKSAGNVVDDNTVNASVKAALLEAKGVPSSQIVVETYKGVVLLSGFVDSGGAAGSIRGSGDGSGSGARTQIGARKDHAASGGL